MELVLVVLTPPTPTAGMRISPQILTDILWGNADSADGLEHANVRAGPEPGSYTAGLFIVPDPRQPGTAADVAFRTVSGLCRRALITSPALSGWSAALASMPGLSPSPDAGQRTTA